MTTSAPNRNKNSNNSNSNNSDSDSYSDIRHEEGSDVTPEPLLPVGSLKQDLIEADDVDQDDPDDQQEQENFETVIAAMGHPGLYQHLQISMLFTCILPQAFIVINFVFLALQPPFKCSRINETEYFGDEDLSSYNGTSHLETFYYHPCEIKAPSDLYSESARNWNTSHCINGYNFTGGQHVSIVTEWELVCDKNGVAELAQSVISFGWFLGVLVFSILADRFGRKNILIVSAVVASAVAFATAFAPNIYVLVTLRFFSGFFSSGLGVTSFVMGTELLVSKHRETYGMVCSVLWSVAAMLLCCIAYTMRHSGWRNLQLCMAGVGAVPLLFAYFIDETALWYYSRGRCADATRIVIKACRVNGKTYYGRVQGTFSECLKKQTSRLNREPTKAKSVAVLDVFKDRKLLVVSLVVWLAWFTNDTVFYGMYLTASTLVGDFYLNIFIMSLLETPGCLVNLVILRYKGRRFVIIMFLSMAAVYLLVSTCLVATGQGDELKAYASTALFLLGKFAISSSYATLYMYTPEVFPTAVRSSCMGIGSACACVGGIMSPYLLPLFDVAPWAPGTIMCGLCCGTLLLLPLLPETKGRQLSDGIAK